MKHQWRLNKRFLFPLVFFSVFFIFAIHSKANEVTNSNLLTRKGLSDSIRNLQIQLSQVDKEKNKVAQFQQVQTISKELKLLKEYNEFIKYQERKERELDPGPNISPLTDHENQGIKHGDYEEDRKKSKIEEKKDPIEKNGRETILEEIAKDLFVLEENLKKLKNQLVVQKKEENSFGEEAERNEGGKESNKNPALTTPYNVPFIEFQPPVHKFRTVEQLNEAEKKLDLTSDPFKRLSPENLTKLFSLARSEDPEKRAHSQKILNTLINPEFSKVIFDKNRIFSIPLNEKEADWNVKNFILPPDLKMGEIRILSKNEILKERTEAVSKLIQYGVNQEDAQSLTYTLADPKKFSEFLSGLSLGDNASQDEKRTILIKAGLGELTQKQKEPIRLGEHIIFPKDNDNKVQVTTKKEYEKEISGIKERYAYAKDDRALLEKSGIIFKKETHKETNKEEELPILPFNKGEFDPQFLAKLKDSKALRKALDRQYNGLGSQILIDSLHVDATRARITVRTHPVTKADSVQVKGFEFDWAKEIFDQANKGETFSSMAAERLPPSLREAFDKLQSYRNLEADLKERGVDLTPEKRFSMKETEFMIFSLIKKELDRTEQRELNPYQFKSFASLRSVAEKFLAKNRKGYEDDFRVLSEKQNEKHIISPFRKLEIIESERKLISDILKGAGEEKSKSLSLQELFDNATTASASGFVNFQSGIPSEKTPIPVMSALIHLAKGISYSKENPTMKEAQNQIDEISKSAARLQAIDPEAAEQYRKLASDASNGLAEMAQGKAEQYASEVRQKIGGAVATVATMGAGAAFAAATKGTQAVTFAAIGTRAWYTAKGIQIGGGALAGSSLGAGFSLADQWAKIKDDRRKLESGSLPEGVNAKTSLDWDEVTETARGGVLLGAASGISKPVGDLIGAYLNYQTGGQVLENVNSGDYYQAGVGAFGVAGLPAVMHKVQKLGGNVIRKYELSKAAKELGVNPKALKERDLSHAFAREVMKDPSRQDALTTAYARLLYEINPKLAEGSAFSKGADPLFNLENGNETEKNFWNRPREVFAETGKKLSEFKENTGKTVHDLLNEKKPSKEGFLDRDPYQAKQLEEIAKIGDKNIGSEIQKIHNLPYDSTAPIEIRSAQLFQKLKAAQAPGFDPQDPRVINIIKGDSRKSGELMRVLEGGAEAQIAQFQARKGKPLSEFEISSFKKRFQEATQLMKEEGWSYNEARKLIDDLGFWFAGSNTQQLVQMKRGVVNEMHQAASEVYAEASKRAHAEGRVPDYKDFSKVAAEITSPATITTKIGSKTLPDYTDDIAFNLSIFERIRSPINKTQYRLIEEPQGLMSAFMAKNNGQARSLISRQLEGVKSVGPSIEGVSVFNTEQWSTKKAIIEYLPNPEGGLYFDGVLISGEGPVFNSANTRQQVLAHSKGYQKAGSVTNEVGLMFQPKDNIIVIRTRLEPVNMNGLQDVIVITVLKVPSTP